MQPTAYILRRDHTTYRQEDRYAVSIIRGTERRAIYVNVVITRDNSHVSAVVRPEVPLTPDEETAVLNRMVIQTQVGKPRVKFVPCKVKTAV